MSKLYLYSAACNCDDCRQSGWRVPQLILAAPKPLGDIVIYGVPGPTATFNREREPG